MRLCSRKQPSNFSPIFKSLAQLFSVSLCSELMLLGMKVIANGSKCRKKALCLPRRFESSHSSFSDACGLMRILRSIIQSLVLSVLDTLEHLVFSGLIAFQLIGDDHPWGKALFFEQFAEKSLCCLGIPMPLHQNVQHITLRIHCSPQVILLSFDRDNHLTLDAICLQCKGVYAAIDLHIAAQISGTIPESIRSSPQSLCTASFSRVSR